MWQPRIAAIGLFLANLCLGGGQRNLTASEELTDNLSGNSSTSIANKDDNCVCVPDGICNTGIRQRDSYDKLKNPHSYRYRCEKKLHVCCKPSNIIPINRIKERAQVGEFPWMVLVAYRFMSSDPKLRCAGSLIHPKAVLTAASYFERKKPEQVSIRVGDLDIDTDTDNKNFPYQDMNVARIAIHPEYNSSEVYNDYAILVLADDVDFNDNVKLVNLIQQDTRFNSSRCFGLGWGVNVHNEPSGMLKKIELPIIPRLACDNLMAKYASDNGIKGHFVRKHEICAGGNPGKNLCMGDGGGPLVCQIQNDSSRYVQVGLVSWNVKDQCFKGLPTIFADVTRAREWINSVITQIEKNDKHWYCTLLSWVWKKCE